MESVACNACTGKEKRGQPQEDHWGSRFSGRSWLRSLKPYLLSSDKDKASVLIHSAVPHPNTSLLQAPTRYTKDSTHPHSSPRHSHRMSAQEQIGPVHLSWGQGWARWSHAPPCSSQWAGCLVHGTPHLQHCGERVGQGPQDTWLCAAYAPGGWHATAPWKLLRQL